MSEGDHEQKGCKNVSHNTFPPELGHTASRVLMRDAFELIRRIQSLLTER